MDMIISYYMVWYLCYALHLIFSFKTVVTRVELSVWIRNIIMNNKSSQIFCPKKHKKICVHSTKGNSFSNYQDLYHSAQLYRDVMNCAKFYIYWYTDQW